MNPARAGRPKAGLRQGYLILGGVYHQILLHLHQHGPAGRPGLAECLPEYHPRIIGVALLRLHTARFVHLVSRERDPVTRRPHLIYGLKKAKQAPPPARLSQAEKCRAYRERKKLRAVSVFDWRGTLCVTRNSDGA